MAKQEKIGTRKNKKPSTQGYLDILEIRDNTVIMKDSTLRAVILVSSVNFSLKSEEEQDATISGYIQFLNTLDFPIQIIVQSRQLNIDNYMEQLKSIEKEQTNELLRMQTQEYRQYVSELVEMADIMSKRFYVVVPYSAGSLKSKGFVSTFKEALSPTAVIHIKQKKFEKFRVELLKRVDYISSGLSAIGLKSIVLDTQSLIELYYNTYNPDTYSQQKLVNINKLNIEQ